MGVPELNYSIVSNHDDPRGSQKKTSHGYIFVTLLHFRTPSLSWGTVRVRVSLVGGKPRE